MATLFRRLMEVLAGASESELRAQAQYLKAENEILRARPGAIVTVVPASALHYHAGFAKANTTSRRIRPSIDADSAPRFGGGMYRRFAGSARDWRDSSFRPCRSATATTIAELRTKVPRTVESPTT